MTAERKARKPKVEIRVVSLTGHGENWKERAAWALIEMHVRNKAIRENEKNHAGTRS
jgi:hypothetical protein